MLRSGALAVAIGLCLCCANFARAEDAREPTRINLETAEALGITIPQTLRLQATDVIP
jgi:hypothetical protein